MNYKILHNVGSEKSFLDGYRQGDFLVVGFEGEIDLSGDITSGSLEKTAEMVFYRHNRDDRPDAETAPSLSVGDVIVFGEIAVSVLPIGFTHVTVDPSDILDETFIEFISKHGR